MKWLFVLLFLAACSGPKEVAPIAAAPTAPAAGGTDFGGGGDLVDPATASHWFPGETSVSYCVEAAPDFAVAKGELLALVAGSFARWEKYIEDKKLPAALSIRPVLQEQCDASVKTVFLFGVWRDELRDGAAHYKNPVSFAHKRGEQGFVWFDSLPNWSQGEGLRSMLLHELGHVYGNPHVPGTVMREDLAHVMGDLPAAWIGEIDYGTELAHCSGCDLRLTELGRASDADRERAFSNFFGRPTEGEVTVEFTRKFNAFPGEPVPVETMPPGLAVTVNPPIERLVLRDGKGEVTWSGWGTDEVHGQATGFKVFSWEGMPSKLRAFNGAIQYRVELRSRTGKPMAFSVQFSSAQAMRPARLLWLDVDSWIEIAR